MPMTHERNNVKNSQQFFNDSAALLAPKCFRIQNLGHQEKLGAENSIWKYDQSNHYSGNAPARGDLTSKT